MARIEDVDLLVVGGGKAGKTLAMQWASSGRRVAMVERGWIGGTCINVACIPTKTLVTSARAARTVRRARELGLVWDGPGADGTGGDGPGGDESDGLPAVRGDAPALHAHERTVVDAMIASNHRQFLDSGMDFVLGEAVFVEPRTVRVTAGDGTVRLLRGADTVINTGTRPALPPLAGLADVGALTSETLLELARVPDGLLVLGGGVVGVELAQMFAMFGSRVTVVERGPRLLADHDPEVSTQILTAFAEDGIDVRLGVGARGVRRTGATVVMTLDDGGEVSGDDLLVATGRTPATSGLGLASAGVETDERGYVVVDDHLRTTADRTWAAGDVAGTAQFTHASLDDYRVLRANLDGGDVSTTGRLIPSAVFVEPEVATIGMTEAQARAAGHEVRVARIPTATIPRARTLRQTAGSWTAVVDAMSDRILGATLIGPEAGESLSTVQLAMNADLPYQALADAILIHPTMTEGFNLLFQTLD